MKYRTIQTTCIVICERILAMFWGKILISVLLKIVTKGKKKVKRSMKIAKIKVNRISLSL